VEKDSVEKNSVNYGGLRAIQAFLHGSPTAIPLFVLLLGIAFFYLLVGARFVNPFNLSLILQQVAIIGFLSMGQTLIILTAGIDLSVGAIMVLTSVIMGRLAVVVGLPVELAFVLGMLAGLGCGMLNGSLVTIMKLPPFIVTLGSWSIFAALNLYISRSETIRAQDVAAQAGFLQWTGQTINIAGAQITYGIILLLILAVALWYMLNWTAFGRHIYAVGDDPKAAALAGISITRTLLAVYVLAGTICAIAAWALIGRIGAISSISGGNANLDSITAVVIGGTSLFGGRGSIIGTLIGVIIVGVFRNGIALAGADALWQEFTIGLLIIIAVSIDQWIRRISA